MKQLELKVGEGLYEVTFRHERIPVHKSRIRSQTICTINGGGRMIAQGVAYRSRLDRERVWRGARISFLKALKQARFDKTMRKIWWDAIVPTILKEERENGKA